MSICRIRGDRRNQRERRYYVTPTTHWQVFSLRFKLLRNGMYMYLLQVMPKLITSVGCHVTTTYSTLAVLNIFLGEFRCEYVTQIDSGRGSQAYRMND